MNSKRKILFLGRPGTGKTSIKQVIFDGTDPMVLLHKPLKATRSLVTAMHPWLELKLGIFDMPGQILNKLLKDEKLQIKAFSKTDIIIYIFDYRMWSQEGKQSLIREDIKEISKLIEQKGYSGEIILVMHKIDLIKNSMKETLQNIEKSLKEEFNLKIYFTSIFPKFLFYLYSTIYEILNQFSEEKRRIKEILDEKISEISNTMIFATNSIGNIITQAATPDFDFKIIHDIYELINKIDKTMEKVRTDDTIDHFMLQTGNGFQIIMKNMSHSSHDVKNLIGISAILKPNKLIFMIGEISRDIYNYYYKGI